MALRSGGGSRANDDDDDDFYSGSRGASESQRLLVREQDETIASLSTSVDRVQSMAIRVNEELASQNRLIGEIDDDVEKTDSRLKQLNTQLRKLSQDQDRGKYCVICVLTGVLIVLVMLVLS